MLLLCYMLSLVTPTGEALKISLYKYNDNKGFSSLSLNQYDRHTHKTHMLNKYSPIHRVLTSLDRMEASFSLPVHPHLHSPSTSHFTSHPQPPTTLLCGVSAGCAMAMPT